MVGSGLVQDLSRIGSSLVQDWFMIVSWLVQGWSRGWSRIGSG